MEPRIRIRSHVVGFRRAGVAHEADRIWPAGHFTPEQLEILKGEPTLTVIEMPPVEPEAPAGAQLNSEDRPAAEPEVQKAEPEPIDGARPEGTDAQVSRPNPAETGEAADAGPDIASAADPAAKTKPAAAKKAGGKKAD